MSTVHARISTNRCMKYAHGLPSPDAIRSFRAPNSSLAYCVAENQSHVLESLRKGKFAWLAHKNQHTSHAFNFQAKLNLQAMPCFVYSNSLRKQKTARAPHTTELFGGGNFPPSTDLTRPLRSACTPHTATHPACPLILPMATPLPPSPPPAPQPIPSAAPPIRRLKRIRFNASWDLILLKTVSAIESHVAPLGDTQRRFEECLDLFLSSAPGASLDGVQLPTGKTLIENLRKFISDHRAPTKSNARASGITEVRGERKQLLYDLILEMDEDEEHRHAERNEKSEKDRKLLAAGVEIREKTLRRSANEKKDDGVVDFVADSVSVCLYPDRRPGSGHKRKHRVTVDSDDEEKEMMIEDLRVGRGISEKQLQVEEARLGIVA